MSRELIAEFCVDGEPVSKSRARFTKRGSKTMAYTPEKTLAAERMVALAFRQVAGSHVPDSTHAYEVDAAFFTGTRQRRDVDNMVKLICDGLNRVAWADDNQVTRISGRKDLVDREKACSFVRIYRLGPVDARRVPCEGCGTEFDWYPSQSRRRFCSQECHYETRRGPRMTACVQCGSDFDRGSNHSAIYCSRECKSDAGRRTLACSQCGVTFTKQLSYVRERNYCSPSCQQDYLRDRRAKAAKGTCATCGGSTSKKSYTNCRACVMASRGVTGDPLTTTERKS